jgi:hypothetical protein
MRKVYYTTPVDHGWFREDFVGIFLKISFGVVHFFATPVWYESNNYLQFPFRTLPITCDRLIIQEEQHLKFALQEKDKEIYFLYGIVNNLEVCLEHQEQYSRRTAISVSNFTNNMRSANVIAADI